MSSKLVTLPQIVDLALGRNQHHIVNFGILHSLLHIIIRQLNTENTRVEFSNQNWKLIDDMVADLNDDPATMFINEYEVEQNDSAEKGYDIKGMIVHDEDEEMKYLLAIQNASYDFQIDASDFQSSRISMMNKDEIENEVDGKFDKSEIKTIMQNNASVRIVKNRNDLSDIRSDKQMAIVTGKDTNNVVKPQQGEIFNNTENYQNLFSSINTNIAEFDKTSQASPKSNYVPYDLFQLSSNIINEKFNVINSRTYNIESTIEFLEQSNKEMTQTCKELKKLIEGFNIDEIKSNIKAIKCSLVELTERVNSTNAKCNVLDQKLTDTIEEIKSLIKPLFDDDEVKYLKSTIIKIPQIESSIDDLKRNKADLILFTAVNSAANRIFKFENEFIDTMEEVQKMLNGKFDNLHVENLKKFIEEILLKFQYRLDQFSKLLCYESAGTTCKLLRNLQCATCGQVSSQRPHVDNLLQKMPNSIEGKVIKKELALRFVGGSHTKVACEEKVVNKICFKQLQISPRIMIRGTNGRLYYGTE